ncbi:MAG: hypothetical protein ACTSR3_00290, partial [Candidatus Helarchaeota archaeon]
MNELECFYKRYGFFQLKLEIIKNKLKEIEKKSEIYSYSRRLEKFNDTINKSIMKAEERKANESPAIKYYDFLKRFEINFVTEDEIDTNVVYLTGEPVN